MPGLSARARALAASIYEVETEAQASADAEAAVKAAAEAEAKARADEQASIDAQAKADAQARADERRERFERASGKPEGMSSQDWALMRRRADAGTLTAQEFAAFIGYLSDADEKYPGSGDAWVSRLSARRNAVRARRERMERIAVERNKRNDPPARGAYDPYFGMRGFAA